MKRRIIFLTLILLIAASLSAQDFGFGFGFDDEESSSFSSGNNLSVSINGEVSASMVGYFDEFSEGFDSTRLGDIFTGKLNFSAGTSIAEGVINLNLQPTFIPFSPISIDEAYLRVYLGSFDVTAGLRKLTWGKADSMGPLDVINPLDTSRMFTEMAGNTSLMGVKIARPLVHASFRFGQSSKIEGVFVPWFEPYRIVSEGRWAPAQMEMLKGTTISIPIPMPVPQIIEIPVKINTTEPPDTTTLSYAQAGLRFTTSIGSVDLGAQYYFGRLPQPSVKTNIKINANAPVNPLLPIPSSVDVGVSYLYNPYHQIGLDYAQVLFGFNVRAEFAANITEDTKGDDGSVYNPSIAWSLGFDRDLVWGINLNFQVNETIRLMHDKLGNDMTTLMANLSDDINTGKIAITDVESHISRIDIEGGSPLTSTRLTVAFSKKFLRDELELRTAVVWGIEDSDCLIMPALIWTKDALRFAFSCGFFAGDKEGQLGQYRDNSFLKLSLTYMF